MEQRRVVVTGLGAITPLGNTVSQFWDNIKNGVNGIKPITRFDTEGFDVRIAAEVVGFDAVDYMDRRDARKMDLFSQYAVAAAVGAVEDSGYTKAGVDNRRVGVIFGSGIGGLSTLEEQITKYVQKGPKRVSPLYIPMALENMAAGHIAIRFGTKGVCTSIVTACATSANCIGEGFRYIKHGYADIIIAGGSEAPVTPTGVAGFSSLTTLAETDDVNRASIPFDKDRKGFVMGEGAGALVLEELEHALKRGAKIYGEVVGYGSTCDAFHMTAPDSEGAGLGEAVKLALWEAGITAADIAYVNAHGTSTKVNDVAETKAIRYAFGEYANGLSVSSTKSMTGHMLGAAGAAEAIVSIMAVAENFAPPTIGLEVEDEECDLDYTKKIGRAREINYAISNSMGFGGHNAALCVKAWR